MRIAVFLVAVLLCVGGASAFLLDPGATASGCGSGKNYSDCYDELQNSQWANGNVTRVVNGVLVVPWYSTSSACGVSNLHSGSNCNIGTVNENQYCMVSDEHSVVVRNVALGNNQTRMDLAYNSIFQMKGSYGQLPGWRCLVNQTSNTINCTDSRVNSNGDSASDATARYIHALFIAANNTAFNATARQNYHNLAVNLTRDFYTYETVKSCYNSTQGNGQVCVWSAGGANVASCGLTCNDFMFTGYFGDNIIAFLTAYKATGNTTYLAAARNITIQYLDAANYTGASFTAPPGKSFKYSITATKPVAVCTNTCSPDQWDNIDAPRAYTLGLAQYYAVNASITTLPNMTAYLSQWYTRHHSIIGNGPVQFFPNGTASSSNKTDYYSVGLMALLASGTSQNNFKAQLDDAMGHYSSSPKTWDWTACYGVYAQQSPTLALGIGVGRDNGLFGFSSSPPPPPPETPTGNITVSIYNAQTNALINDTNVTVRLTFSTGSSTIVTQNGTATFLNRTNQTYTLTLNATGYDTAQYTFSTTPGVNTNFTAYLSEQLNVTGELSVIINIVDFNTGESIEGALVLMATDINDTLTTVQSRTSDVTGRVFLTHTANTRYTFTISKENYATRIFTLDPIIFTSYDVKINRIYASNQDADYSGVNIRIHPTIFKNQEDNTLYLSVTSPAGILEFYNFTVSYPGASFNRFGSTPQGETFVETFNITGATIASKVNISYCYDTTIGPQRCFNNQYSIIVNATGNTWAANKDSTYGLGLLERAVVAVVAVIIIVGLSMALSGPLVSTVLGLLLFGFFVSIGFLPLWTVLLSMLLGMFILTRRSGE
jgi:hypothetical protein